LVGNNSSIDVVSAKETPTSMIKKIMEPYSDAMEPYSDASDKHSMWGKDYDGAVFGYVLEVEGNQIAMLIAQSYDGAWRPTFHDDRKFGFAIDNEAFTSLGLEVPAKMKMMDIASQSRNSKAGANMARDALKEF